MGITSITKATKGTQQGYLLVATILLGLGISIIAGANLQFTAQTNRDLVTQSYQTIAQEAARAGISYAGGCLSTLVVSWSPLSPGTDCTGTGNGASTYLTQQGTEWRSTFSVTQPDAQSNVISTGTVEILSNGTVVQRYTAKSKMNLTGFITTYPISTGESLTDVKNDVYNDCAIANGKLYCWGANYEGEVGDGTTTPRATPTLVQGALAGKTVTKVSVARTAVCAIADGTPYCWGDNGNYQLGDGTTTAKYTPTAGVPRTSSGPLSGKLVTDISTASPDQPFVLWPFAYTGPHSCALSADGAVSCWGYGAYRQLTGGGMTSVCVFICVPTGYYSYPDQSVPTAIAGYDGSGGVPQYGRKTIRVAASSHDSCFVAIGTMTCAGVQAPLNPLCVTDPQSAFAPAPYFFPWNVCIGGYSNGYDAGYDLAGRYIDPSTWDMSTNEVCYMASADFECFGETAALSFLFLSSFSPPTIMSSASWGVYPNPDVTAVDNGEDSLSSSLSGTYCIVDRGTAKCAGTAGSATGWTFGGGFTNLVITSGLAGKVPTKIAASPTHGCLSANGQLLCWGSSTYCVTADGSCSGTNPYAHVTGSVGGTPIGTASGDYAASGSISVGGNHACGVANGKLFCWGDNTYGQLGQGNNNDLSVPQSIYSLNTYNSVTKVSTGLNHTCAIAYGKLFCWGRNNQGQLGIGNTTDQNTPQQVGGTIAGMRVTDVSAGADGTCAIANGQAYCWGNNANQQLGDGTTTQRSSPVQVTGGSGVLTGKAITSISIGTTHACAVANGDLYCWGNNANGRTGLGTTTSNANPTLVTGGTASQSPAPGNSRALVTQVSAGDDFTCAIINGTVSCWGDNANGRTGLNTSSGNQTTPAAVKNSSGVAVGYYATTISAGNSHACAVLNGNNSATNGNLYCWGMGLNGRIGNNSTSDRINPTVITGGDTVDPLSVRRVGTAIAAGASSTCAVANGVILCWGAGADGRLGNNTIIDSTVPDAVLQYRVIAPYNKGPIF